jgi:hypothetical protein
MASMGSFDRNGGESIVGEIDSRYEVRLIGLFPGWFSCYCGKVSNFLSLHRGKLSSHFSTQAFVVCE